MQDKAQIQQLCLFAGELLVCPVGGEDMLRRALAGHGQVQVHALLVVHALFHLIGVYHHAGHGGNERNALAHDIGQRQLVRVIVVRIQRQHAARHFVHDIGAGRLHNHVFHKIFRQLAELLQRAAKACKLALRGQRAKQQQPDDLFEHKAVFLIGCLHNAFYVDAAVNKLAVRRGAQAIHHFIAHYVAHIRKPCQHARSVRVAQAPLHAKALAFLGVYEVIFQVLLT